MSLTQETPKNIAIEPGKIQVQADYIEAWKTQIISERDRDMEEAPDLAKVYKHDAQDLLDLANALKAGCTQGELHDLIDFDTIVRERVPGPLWNLILESLDGV